MLSAVSELTAAPRPTTLSVHDLAISVEIGAKREAVRAVDGVSFEIGPGRVLGLVGESGCGKSLTALGLMRLLAEPRLRIAAGEIRFAARDLASASDAAMQSLRGHELAMIFQEPSTALNPVFPIGVQVGEPLRIHKGYDRARAFKEAVGLLELVGIPDAAERAHNYPHQLSGGMKQRAMIAMALACRPSLLIADEPTTALDVTVQAQILALLGRLQRELGMALLLITHDLGVVAETCDDVAVMYAGRIVEQGTAEAILNQPRHPYTVGLLAAMRTLEASAAGGAQAGKLREIPGTVPALGQLPPGCPFAPRCDRAQEICRLERPQLAANGPITSHGEDLVTLRKVAQATAELPFTTSAGTTNHAWRCFFPVGLS